MCNIRGMQAAMIALVIGPGLFPLAAQAEMSQRPEIMAVGLDEKFAYEDGKRIAREPGHDAVWFYELKDPGHPEKIGELSLENSIVGPPTNIAITPDQKIALIANALHSERTLEGAWKAVPAEDLFVVDLTARPVKLIATVKVGHQPSGIALNREGTLALVANRDSKTISVLSIRGMDVAVTQTLEMADTVAAIAIAPDGRRAIATKTQAHKVSLLSIDADGKAAFERDIWVGLFPWNISITPDGATALVNNIGNAGQSDGNTDTVCVIDLTSSEPHVIDTISVGDAPEGITIRPQGDLIALTLLAGSYDSPNAAWYRREAGKVQMLGIASGKVTALGAYDVGSFPEGIAFSQDGHFIYAGNFASSSVSILKVKAGGVLEKAGVISLPGHPGSLRIGSR